MRQLCARRQERPGHVGAVQVEPVDVVAGRARGVAGAELGCWIADTSERLNKFHAYTGADQPVPAGPGTGRTRCSPTRRTAGDVDERPRGARRPQELARVAQVRPGDRGERGHLAHHRVVGDRGPGLDRAPVVSQQMDRPTPRLSMTAPISETNWEKR